jgi:hypothetical protein
VRVAGPESEGLMPAMLYGKQGEKVCWRHKRGVDPSWGPWFVAGCVRCEAKAEKDPSLRNAPSLDGRTGTRAGREARGERIDIAKHRKQLQARRLYYAQLPATRTA